MGTTRACGSDRPLEFGRTASESKGQGRRLAMRRLLYRGKCNSIRLHPLTVSIVFEYLSLPLHTERYSLGINWNADVL